MDALSILALGVAQAGGGGGGTSYTAGDGIDITNNEISIDLERGGGLDVNQDGELNVNWSQADISLEQEHQSQESYSTYNFDTNGFRGEGYEYDADAGDYLPATAVKMDGGSVDVRVRHVMDDYNDKITITGTGIEFTNENENKTLAMNYDGDLEWDGTSLALSTDIPSPELPTISSGDAGKVLTVNSGETGVEWATGGGGGGSYTFTNGLTNNNGTVSWDLNANITRGGYDYSSVGIGNINTINLGNNGYAIAIGQGVWSNGSGSAAIGYGTSSNYIHAGNASGSIAMGYSDQFEGLSSYGKGSVALGYCTKARSNGQIAVGKFNVADNSNTYAFIIGNGSAGTASNALTVDWSGNLVCNNIPACPSTDGTYNLQVSIVNGVPTYSWVAV